jgi:hypothetical protein
MFIDESGDASMGTTPNLVLGGVIIRVDQWPSLNSQLDAIKVQYGFNPSIEIKWRHIRNPGSHTNPVHAFTDNDRVQLGKNVLSIIRGCTSARIMGVVIDKVAAYMRPEIKEPEDIYERAVTFLMERFQYYLKATGDFGLVIQDQRQTGQDIRLRAFYRSLLVAGTRWTRFPAIIENVFLAPSHLSLGIQLADFVAGAIYAAHADKPDNKFFNIIRGKITGDRYTGVRHGLKKWPDPKHVPNIKKR